MPKQIKASALESGKFNSTRGLDKLVCKLGYGSLNEFFDDNPGAIETLLGWVGEQSCFIEDDTDDDDCRDDEDYDCYCEDED